MRVKKYLWGNPLLEAVEQLRRLTSKFVGNIVDDVTSQSREAGNKVKVLSKTNATANRRTKAPMKANELAVLQDKLWELGAFKGVKNRQGKDITYELAVDGLIGNMTRKALANARLMGYNFDNYDINEKSGLVTKKTPSKKITVTSRDNLKKGGLANIYETTHAALTGGLNGFISVDPNSEVYDSLKTDLEAILEHKKRLNVQDNWGYIDKKNKTLSIYQGANLLKQYPVTVGKNKGDYSPRPTAKYLNDTGRTTGAGVFVLASKPTSKYTGHEPMYVMAPDSMGAIALALHSPANYTDRVAPFKNPKLSKRVSYGCVSGNCGTLSEIYNNKLLQTGDTMYVAPEIDGNALVENKGKIKMHWGENNPETFTNGKGYTLKAYYNNRY